MCSVLPELLGHEAVKGRLAQALRRGRLAQAYLCAGPEGVGKFLLACALVRRFLCRADGASDCSCRSCRLVRAGTHPDLFLLDLEEAPRLSIDAIRRLAAWATRKPRLGPGLAAVLRDAERLTEEAQNALLKTLEEPPPGALLVLTSAYPHRLLPTIRSRCQALHLGGLDEASVAAILQRAGVPGGSVPLLAALAQGSPGRALTWWREELLPHRTLLLAVLAGNAPPAEASLRLGEWLRATGEGGARRAAGLLELWLTVARDLLVASVGGEALWNRDLREALKSLAKQDPPRRWEALAEHLVRGLRALELNAAPDLVVTELLLTEGGQK